MTVIEIKNLDSVAIGENCEIVVSFDEQLVEYCAGCESVLGMAEDVALYHFNFHDKRNFKEYTRYAVYGDFIETNLDYYQSFFTEKTFTDYNSAFFAYRELQALAQKLTNNN